MKRSSDRIVRGDRDPLEEVHLRGLGAHGRQLGAQHRIGSRVDPIAPRRIVALQRVAGMIAEPVVQLLVVREHPRRSRTIEHVSAEPRHVLTESGDVCDRRRNVDLVHRVGNRARRTRSPSTMRLTRRTWCSGCESVCIGRERGHAAIAYNRPVGDQDSDADPVSRVDVAPMRVVRCALSARYRRWPAIPDLFHARTCGDRRRSTSTRVADAAIDDVDPED